jgi:hypothetical protein
MTATLIMSHNDQNLVAAADLRKGMHQQQFGNKNSLDLEGN